MPGPDPSASNVHKTVVIGRTDIARELAGAVHPDAGGTGHPTPPAIGHPPPRPAVLPPGNLSPLDRYELRGEIARGGMGILIRARDSLIGRELVIKLLREEYRGMPAAERRFLREARVNGQLQHPGIVPVYDVGRFPDGRPFLTMKYAYGRTLDALLAARPSPAHDLSRFVRVFEQVCQTVAYAHAKGVIHRDLKPLNVMVSGFGQVRVLDWGLAKVISEWGTEDAAFGPAPRAPCSDFDTAFGAAVGTPAYIPPEQAAGRHDRLDERCDVFGLGGILCTILTGRPPYAGDRPDEVWARAKAGDLADAHARLARSADPGLAALARWCLAHDPADRPRSADEVADSLAAGRGPASRRRGVVAALARWLGQ